MKTDVVPVPKETRRVNLPVADSLLTRILHVFEGASTFFFFLMLTVTYLYVIGNIQNFTSKTQELLLTIMRVIGVASVGINTYALLVIIVWSINHRRLLLLRFIFSLFSLGVALLLTLGAGFITLLINPSW